MIIILSKPKKRYRRKKYNWPLEINNGNTAKFYQSTDWREMREYVLARDKFICQFYAGNFTQNGYEPDKIKLVRATHVHHIKPLKEYPELCLDPDNLVALSHKAHEIVEGRIDMLKEYSKKQRKKPLTKERW